MSVNRKKKSTNRSIKKNIRKQKKELPSSIYIKLLQPHGIYSTGDILSMSRELAEEKIKNKEAELAPRNKDDRDVAAEVIAEEES